MKILLIGHSIIDKMEKGNQIKISPGGIYYSLLGFLSVKNQNDQLFLVTGFNNNSYNLYENLYNKACLDFSNEIKSLPEVFLEVPDVGERRETYSNLSTTLDLNKIENPNYFDGILINMTTGFDISLEELIMLRKNYYGPIYFDLHTLSRGVNRNLKREFRQVPNAKEWISNIDLLQCNEMELKTLYHKTDEKEIINFVFQCGIKYLIVTRGNKGAEIFYKGKSKIDSIKKSASVINVVNKIGCGDIFGSVFFYNYLCHSDINKSLEQAIKKADQAVSINLLENINLFIHD